MRWCASFVGLGCMIGLAVAQTPLDASKIPAALKPTPDAPMGVVAVFNNRDGQVDTLAFRPDGKMLAISGPDVGIRFWDLATWKQVATVKLNRVTAMAFSPDGKLLAVGDADGALRFFTLAGPKPVPRPPVIAAHKDGPLWTLTFRPDGRTLVSGGSDGVIKSWDVATGKLKATLKGHNKYIRGLTFTPDGDLLASAGADDLSLRLWDFAANPPEQIEQFDNEKAVAHVDFTLDGTKMAAATYDGKIRVWKTDQSPPKELEPIPAPRNAVRMAHFGPDGKTILGLVKGPERDEVIWWQLIDKGSGIRKEWKLPTKAAAIAWAPDGKHFAVVNEDSTYLIRVD